MASTDSLVKKIVARGYSEEHARSWVAENGTQDASRIDSAFPTQAKTPASTSALNTMTTPSASTGGGAPTGSIPGASAPTVAPMAGSSTPPSMTALDTATKAPAAADAGMSAGLSIPAMFAGQAGATTGEPTDTSLVNPLAGLRALGRRMPPVDNMALAGLQRRIY